MQNRYVGDIGDFGKYGLLRKLCGISEPGKQLSLGIAWYLVPDEPGTDGRHTDYLNPTQHNNEHYRACDEVVYDSLKSIVESGERNVKKIRESNIFPSKTRYFEEKHFTFDGMRRNGEEARNERIEYRKNWVRRTRNEMSGCDVVFFDPDNGLEVKSYERHHKRGPKYVFFDDLKDYVKRGQSLIIYQHQSRQGSKEVQIRNRCTDFAEQLGIDSRIYTLVFNTISVRFFFVIPCESHREQLIDRTESLVNGPWSEHFELVK